MDLKIYIFYGYIYLKISKHPRIYKKVLSKIVDNINFSNFYYDIFLKENALFSLKLTNQNGL